MSDGDIDDLRADIGATVTAMLSKHERSMTTKWFVLAETIDEDGERGLWTLASDGATSWDVKGMLREALDVEAAKTFADYLRNE